MRLSKHITVAVNRVRLLVRFGLRKAGVPGFQIHQIALAKGDLIYIPIPKNACSTIKHALYEIEHGKEFDYDWAHEWGFKDIHDYYQKSTNAFTDVSRLKQSSKTVVAVVRDPVKRIVSCYRNRVVDLGDLIQTKESLQNAGLPVHPDLNTFINYLEDYREVNKIIEHHSRPQYRFLGDSLFYVDEVIPLSKINVLEEMLIEMKPDLDLKSEKSGGTSFGLADLSSIALEKAIEFYSRDYELLSEFYSPAQIKEEYQESFS